MIVLKLILSGICIALVTLTLKIFISFFMDKLIFLVGFGILIAFMVVCHLLFKYSFYILKPFKNKFNFKFNEKDINLEFIDKYNRTIKESGKKLEKMRKKCIRFILNYFIFFILLFLFVIGILFIIPSNLEIQYVNKIYFIIFAFALFFATLYYKCNINIYNIYVEEYKKAVVKRFIEQIGDSIEYNSEGNEDICNYYKDSSFYDGEYNNLYNDDYLKIKIEKNDSENNVHICNYSTEILDKNGDFIKYLNKGVFSFAKLEKTYDEIIYIRTKGTIFENEFINKSGIKFNNINIDNIEFNKLYSVMSNSNKEVYEILTEEVINNFIEFYNRFGVDFEIFIKNDTIYIRFKLGIIFEPDIFKKSYNIKTLWLYFNIIIFIVNLFEKINNS